MGPWPKAWSARAESDEQENLLDKQLPLNKSHCSLKSYWTKEGKNHHRQGLIPGFRLSSGPSRSEHPAVPIALAKLLELFCHEAFHLLHEIPLIELIRMSPNVPWGEAVLYFFNARIASVSNSTDCC